MKPELSPAGVYCFRTDTDRPRNRARRGALELTAWWFFGLVCAMPVGAATPQAGGTAGVGFSALEGPTGAPYLGSEEAEFVITPTLGDWRQSLVYGNPGSSIFAGPINDPQPATIQVTDSLAPFRLLSFDYSSNNGESAYDIQGFLGPTLQFHETGTLAASFSPFSFSTIISPYSSFLLDGLFIQVIPGPGVTSINLDNINMVTVPEPGELALIVLGALVLTFRRRVN